MYTDLADWVNPVKPIAHSLEDDGSIPNNPLLPLLVYPGVLKIFGNDPASIPEAVFRANGWGDCWRNGVYPFPHYHAEAHEVLGVFNGSATLQLGGRNGVTLEVHVGDVIVIPAGVGHENLGAKAGFGVVGAYPSGQSPDMKRGDRSERPHVIGLIAEVPLPKADPVHGPDGPLINLWI